MAETTRTRRRRTSAASLDDAAAPEFPTLDDPAPPPSAEDAAPKRAPGKANKNLQARLEQFFSAMALPFAMAGDAHCAGIVAQGAPGLAESWANLANENPGVKRVLERLLAGGAWGGVIASTLSIALPIAAHHGLALPLPGMPRAPQEQEPIIPPAPSEPEAPATTIPVMDNGHGSDFPHPLGPPQPSEFQ